MQPGLQKLDTRADVGKFLRRMAAAISGADESPLVVVVRRVWGCDGARIS